MYASAHACTTAVVGERVRGPDPQRVGVELLAVDHLGERHLADLEQAVGSVCRAVLGCRRRGLADVVEPALGAAAVERRQHREDHLAVLHRGDVAGRERAAVAVAVDLQQHRPVDQPGTQEVAVQRVRLPVGLDGERGGHERLRAHLAAEQRRPFLRHHRVHTRGRGRGRVARARAWWRDPPRTPSRNAPRRSRARAHRSRSSPRSTAGTRSRSRSRRATAYAPSG